MFKKHSRSSRARKGAETSLNMSHKLQRKLMSLSLAEMIKRQINKEVKTIHCKGCNQQNFKIDELLEVSELTLISLITDFLVKWLNLKRHIAKCFSFSFTFGLEAFN